MTAELARAGGVVGCAGLALLLVAPSRALRLAGLVAWALGAAGLAVYLLPHGHRPHLAAAALVGLVLAAAGAWLLRRWPALLAFAALACFPARIPVSVGSTDANLLVPLYGVVAAAALALGWALLRGDGRGRELGPIAWPLAAFVAWTGLTVLWVDDLRQGSIALLFYYLPFGLLAVAVARLPWRRRWLVALYAQLALMAVAFAATGVYQWTTRDVFWNPKVIVGNAYAPFYRVNSVFWDPSIYGRFLVVAILATLVLALWTRAARVAVVLALVVAATWVGLVLSFSQSSFVALGVGVLAAAAYAWQWRVLAAAGLAAVVLVSVGFAAPNVRHNLLGHSLNRVTSDRYSLVTNGLKIAVHHPVGGVGIGGFRQAYARREHLKGREPKKAASHDTPVTVAAETGAPGLALFAWLLGAALLVAFRRVDWSFVGRTRLFVGIALGTIAVHSLFYNALFEDPMAWALLGLAALAAVVAREREPA
ncbi:MAG TPA: O-antigen ligase family protein [Gaiellaceae bacterium]|nr:O-antigen ligase family protein [Gaiellaceae bacterium]